MKKKKAITLIELIVSITTASILFILLGNIISKKLNAVSLVYEKGTYYCWKDWNGTLYQKTPMGSIQPVSSCRVKIPKNAKNIQSFVIGGGSSGYIFDKNAVDKSLSEKYIQETPKEVSCIENTSYDGYTTLDDNDSGSYIDLTTISQSQKNKLNNALIKPRTLHELLTKDYTENLIRGNHCAVPVYKNGSKIMYKLPSDAKYYFKGSDGTERNCYDQIGTCYKYGFIKDGSLRSLDVNKPDAGPNINNYLTLTTIQPNISMNIKKSSPGEVVLGNAQAGKEYNFTSDNIGSGGTNGGNGKDTKFGGIVAKGGVLKDNNVVINPTTKPVSDIKNQSAGEFNICSVPSAPCNGSFNEQLFKLNLEVKSDKVLSVDFDPKKDKEVSVQTGFGLFGTSGASQDCSIKYYQIKNLKYNGFEDGIGVDIPIAALGSCKSNLTKGMGGAIIIRWD